MRGELPASHNGLREGGAGGRGEGGPASDPCSEPEHFWKGRPGFPSLTHPEPCV